MRHISIALMCAVMAGCGPSPGPEEAVRLWVKDAEASAEEKDRDGLMELISASYADARGNDRSDIEQMLRAYFLRTRDIVLASNIEEVTVMGDSAANVVLTAGMAGANDGVFGLSADAYRFELELENDGDRWMLIGARWAELGDDLR
jgi:hypothetical protein